MKDRISVIIITYKRIDELKNTVESLLKEKDDFLELIIIDNHSEDGTYEYGSKLQEVEEKVHFWSLGKNMGVAGGRNFAMQQAHGEILFFMDDDAVLAKEGAFPRIVDKFRENPQIGVLAFRIINYYTKQMRTEEIPFTNKNLDMTQEWLTSTYIGAGHAIRKEVIDKCGLYPEDYFYGGEELDLSFRIINHGYDILYYPEVEVFHKQVPTGRITNKEKWIMVYRNRLLTAYRYLPKKYQYVSNILWGIKIFIKSGSIKSVIVALKRYMISKKEIHRETISSKTIAYLKKNYGRLWI